MRPRDRRCLLTACLLAATGILAGSVYAWKNTGKWFDIDGDGVNDVHALSKYSRPSLLNKVVTDMVYVSSKAPQTLTKLRFDWKISSGHRIAATIPVCSSNGWCYWKFQNRWSTIHSTPHKSFQIELEPTVTPAIGKITASAPAHEPLPAWSIIKGFKDLISSRASVGGAVIVADARRQDSSGDTDATETSAMTDSDEWGEEGEPSELAEDEPEASEYDDEEDDSEAVASEYGDEGETDEDAGDEPDTSDEEVWLDLQSHVSTEDGETYQYTLTAENNTDATIQIRLVTFVKDLASTLDTKEYSAEPGESVLEELTSDQYPFEVQGSATTEIEGVEIEFFAPVFVPFKEEFTQYDFPEEAPAEDETD